MRIDVVQELLYVNTVMESKMNWDRVEGNWKQIKGKVKEQWGNLTDDDLDRVAGKRDQLVGKIQEGYGVDREAAEQQVKEWEERNHDVFAETAAAVRALPKSLHGTTE